MSAAPGPRVARVVFVAGTGTEVGKTWFTAATVRALRARGVGAAARKPVLSFAAGDVVTDAEVLAEASGQDPADVCPARRRLPLAMAPPMAAEALGRPPFGIAELAAETAASLTHHDVVIVEGAGGVRSPIAADGDNVDLALALRADCVVLVADAGLGTLSSVRLGCEAFLHQIRTRPTVALNRFEPSDDLHRRNLDWLTTREGLEVVTDPEALATALLYRIDRTATGR